MYCGQACRQRAYEQRSATAKAGLPGDVVLVSRSELDGLQDRLYQLRCALEDAQTLLAAPPVGDGRDGKLGRRARCVSLCHDWAR